MALTTKGQLTVATSIRVGYGEDDATNTPNAILDVDGSVGIGTSITIVPYDSLGTLSFEGSAGQLFSITNNLTSGSIFSVNDVSGIPSIDVDADGTIQLAPYSTTEYVGVGTTNPTAKLLPVSLSLIPIFLLLFGKSTGQANCLTDTLNKGSYLSQRPDYFNLYTRGKISNSFSSCF